MPKTAAERKAAQRARQAESGLKKLELALDAQEVDMLAENCALRRPQREPYEMAEYISMLIRRDNAELKAQLEAQSTRCCGKCGDKLPGDPDGCVFNGEADCWQTLGWHETKLTL